LHDAARGLSEFAARLRPRIDAHDNQIGITGCRDANDLDARAAAGDNVHSIASDTWRRHRSTFTERTGAFPAFGKDMNGSHLSTNGTPECERVISGRPRRGEEIDSHENATKSAGRGRRRQSRVDNENRARCVDREAGDQRTHAPVVRVHADGDQVRLHQPGVTQDFTSRITLGHGGADSLPSGKMSREREHVLEHALGIGLRRGRCTRV
jgi:hypothetical protein